MIRLMKLKMRKCVFSNQWQKIPRYRPTAVQYVQIMRDFLINNAWDCCSQSNLRMRLAVTLSGLNNELQHLFCFLSE